MANQSSLQVFRAVIVVGVAILGMGVITLRFIIPEQLFENTLGLVSFFVAGGLMIACAVIANRYDLRSILYNAFG